MTEGDLPLLVVVTGPPAAGKTTIARAAAGRLGLPLVAKDELKEILGDVLGTHGREDSLRLGGATFEIQFHLLRELLGARCSVVAEGNFPADRARRFAALPPARVVQVHVAADPETLRARMLDRPRRHAVHYDVEVAAEVAERARGGEWAALPLEGNLLQIDTTSFPDVAAVADAIATMAAPWSTSRPSSSS